MGEWSTISYLRTADADAAEEAVTRLCAAEGYVPEPVPPAPGELLENYGTWEGPPNTQPLWTFVLLPGAGEWTVLITMPFALLGVRRPGARRLRLADLAVLAGRDAFTFELSDGTAWILAEANARGETAFSGIPYDDDWMYHDEPFGEDDAEVGFRLLDVPEPLRRAGALGLLSFLEIGEYVLGDRYPEEFERDGGRWSRHDVWYNGVQASLGAGERMPLPSDARELFFRAAR